MEKRKGEKHKSILPSVPAEDLLKLSPEEFEQVATSAGIASERLRTMLSREALRNAVKRVEPVSKPREASPDFRTQISQKAFEEAAADFDFLNKQWTQEEIDQLHEAADQFVRDREKSGLIMGQTENAIERRYRKAFIAEAVMKVQPILRNEDAAKACEAAINYLESRGQNLNLAPEQWGINSATREFKRRLKNDKDLQEVQKLYHAYKTNTLDHEQKIILARLLSRARSFAMHGDRYYVNGANDRSFFKEIVPEIAAVIKENRLYGKTLGNTSGNVELYDMPGNRGAGGQLNYYRGSRPHRDDHGATGGRDDK